MESKDVYRIVDSHTEKMFAVRTCDFWIDSKPRLILNDKECKYRHLALSD